MKKCGVIKPDSLASLGMSGERRTNLPSAQLLSLPLPIDAMSFAIALDNGGILGLK